MGLLLAQANAGPTPVWRGTPIVPIILRRLLLHNLSTRSRVGSLEGGVWGAGHREVTARPGLQGPAWGHPQSSPCGDRAVPKIAPRDIGLQSPVQLRPV